jgi:HEAT repeat protein
VSALAPALSAAPKTEAQVLKDLESPKAAVVTRALQQLEKEYPTSTNGFAAMRKLLRDPRPEIKRKSARVMGVLHVPVNDEDIAEVCKLLKASEPAEIIDGLKSLRGLDAPKSVSEIAPLLRHSHPNVIRDACRTLAVLGKKDVIPSIEPLLNHSNAAVRKDAQDAIFVLRAKP